MMPLKGPIHIYEKLPQQLRTFLLKAILLLTCWLLIYYGFLKHTRLLDKQLTDATVYGTSKILGVFYNVVSVYGQRIYVNGTQAVGIADPCNALELFVLYIGFILCIKTNVKRTLFFTASGFVVIYILNISRCAGLAYLNLKHSAFVNFAHHYAFKLIIYGAIFLAWLLYVKKEKNIYESDTAHYQ